MKKSAVVRIALGLLFLFCLVDLASAHHAMGGRTPSSLWEGLLSGLAHPIIGLDHLSFIVAAGLLVSGMRHGPLRLLLFITASTFGVLLHLYGVNLNGAELAIAASIVLAGGWLAWSGRSVGLSVGALLALAGIVHGYAYGEAVAGAETAPIGAYLAGLVVIQLLIGTAAIYFTRVWQLRPADIQLAGAVVLGIGLATFIGQFA